MNGKNMPERLYTPTVLQHALGNPLRSEQRAGELLPRVLSPLDMLTIFIAIVVFISNASTVQSAGVGLATYIYWVAGVLTFLVPGAVVAEQLNRFMPVEGSIYVWTHRALGPLWGFLAGFCAWFPGILVLLACSDTIVAFLHGIAFQLQGYELNWLTTPWQQGIVVLLLLLLTGWLATFPLAALMKWAKGIVALYCASILLVGLAGVVWLLRGHPPQASLVVGIDGSSPQTFVLYGVIVLALLGVEVPLNLNAETRQSDAAKLFLRWGPLVALIAYLLGTFGVMMVVSQKASDSPYSTLTAVHIVFGAPVAALVGLIFALFFVISTVLYNMAFARILFVAALDYRLPSFLTRLNRHSAPYWATNVQTIIIMVVTLVVYIIGPLLYPDVGAAFSARIYNVILATTNIIWCLSMLILFVDLPILLVRFRGMLARSASQLIFPRRVLYLCCLIGGIASLLGIWTTFNASWNPHLISDDQWHIIIGSATVIFLVIGLIAAAYPRLLSNVQEQTAIARENARLYRELQIAYTRLSELDQLKDAFLTTASHELRTPLTIVQGYLELLKIMEDVSAAERQAFITKACRACDELTVLLANIMDASRLQFDAATLHIMDVPLRSTTVAIVDLFEPLIRQKLHTIRIDIDSCITVKADETRLKQVLHNLLSNALRYSPERTAIQIAAEVKNGNMVRVSVSDRGPGIPPDKQEMIFEKFVRLERDMHGDVRGSGLGLFITRQLVESMKGSIRVESSGIKNEGATFSFTLPSGEYLPAERVYPGKPQRRDMY
jgi:signal transduction histidine kinase